MCRNISSSPSSMVCKIRRLTSGGWQSLVVPRCIIFMETLKWVSFIVIPPDEYLFVSPLYDDLAKYCVASVENNSGPISVHVSLSRLQGLVFSEIREVLSLGSGEILCLSYLEKALTLLLPL